MISHSPLSQEFWDERYGDPHRFFYGERPNDFLAAHARLIAPGSRVLCLADGEARNGVWLALQGHHVVSLDFSAVAQEKGRALAKARGVEVEFWCQDLADWVNEPDPEQPWDAVVSIFAHLPKSLAQAVAATATRQTRPGGMLLCEAYTPAQLSLGTGGPKTPDVLLTRTDVQDMWAGWHLDVRLVERRIFEGPGHQGLSSVVQALGRRYN